MVRYRDEDGRFWFLSARGGAAGSDAGAFLPPLRYPPGAERAGRRIPATVFESESEAQAAWPEICRQPVDRGVRPLRFVGWRWRGSRLFRVSHTLQRDRPIPLLGADGQRQWEEPPRRLTVDALVHLDNGVHYNLVDARLPAAEAAERITRVAAMARGTASRGENDYFYDQARKLVAACISLHRETEAAPCTALDVVRLATQEAHLGPALAILESRIAEQRTRGTAARTLRPLEDLAAYFSSRNGAAWSPKARRPR